MRTSVGGGGGQSIQSRSVSLLLRHFSCSNPDEWDLISAPCVRCSFRLSAAVRSNRDLCSLVFRDCTKRVTRKAGVMVTRTRQKDLSKKRSIKKKEDHRRSKADNTFWSFSDTDTSILNHSLHSFLFGGSCKYFTSIPDMNWLSSVETSKSSTTAQHSTNFISLSCSSNQIQPCIINNCARTSGWIPACPFMA